MSIKQINATYQLQEDRILLRINTANQEEFDFLLTRRVTLFILAASEHLVEKQLEQQHEPATAKAVAQFEKTNLGNIPSGPEFEGGTAFPLGNAPILVLDVTCSIVQAPLAEDSSAQEQLFSIDLVLGKDQSINLKLPKPMLLGLRALLEQICDQASWGRAVLAQQAPEVSSATLVDVPGGPSTLH